MYLRVNEVRLDHVQKRCGRCRSIEVSRSRLRAGESFVVPLTGYRPYRCLDCYQRSWSKYSRIQTQIGFGIALLIFIVAIYLVLIAVPKSTENVRIVVQNKSPNVQSEIVASSKVDAIKEGLNGDVINNARVAESTKLEEIDVGYEAKIRFEAKKEVTTVQAGQHEMLPGKGREENLALIEKEFERWRNAWQKGDADVYLSLYGKDFIPEGTESKIAWKSRRVKSLTKLVEREIIVSDLDLSLSEDVGSADLNFVQTYLSANFSDKVQKRLVVRKEGDDYKIVKEETLKIL